MPSRHVDARGLSAHAIWADDAPAAFWQNQAGILAQPLGAAAQPLGAETPLDDATIVNTTTSGQQYDAAVAALADGGYVIAWDDSGRGDVFGRRYDSSGQAVGSEFQLDITITAGMQAFPSVGGLTGGGFVAAWESGSGSSGEIKAQRFDAAGGAAGTELAVNTNSAGEQRDAHVTGLDGGGFLITWDTTVSGAFQDVSGQLFDAVGNPVGGEFTVNSTTTGQQGVNVTASLAGGGFVAIWQSIVNPGDNINIIGQRFASNGTKLGGEFQVNTDTDGKAGEDAARLPGGGFVVTWVDDSAGLGGNVVGRIYDASGNAVTGEITLFSTTTESLIGTSVAALPSGGFTVIWKEDQASGADVSARAFDATGAALTGAFLVGQSTDIVITQDAATTLPSGANVFVWDGATTPSDQDIYQRRFLGSTGDAQTGTSGDDNKTGTTGDDRFDMSQGGNDIVHAGDGNDGIFFGAALTAADQVDGGPGTNDQIGLQGDYTGANALTLGPTTITGIEAIVVLPGYSYDLTTVDANVAAGGVLSIQATRLGAGESLIFNGAAEHDGSFMIYGGQGNDNLTGGDGDDGFYFGPGGFNGSDTINGGPGSNDQLALDGDYTLTLGGNLSGIEAVVLLHGPAATPNHFNVTAADSLVASGQTMTIFGLQVETAITFNGAGEHDGAFKIYGGLAGDTLTGSDGGDWIFGGAGADTLTGGAGNDIFYYDDPAQSTAAASDSILDFASGDKIDVSGIDAIAGGSDDSFSYLGTGAFTHQAGELRVVDNGGNNWTVAADVDGDGNADLQLIVHVSDAHPLTSADFTL